MKARITLGATVLAILSLAGCASQAQIDEQNKQLAAINVSLTQIQAVQAESLALQKIQTKIQMESHNQQVQSNGLQVEQQAKRK
ncbi:lipoprotein, putative (plasmid) [Pseudomonas fluorescens A506]|nr:lipoprotein, putative [Pseudomonas fluorescens A506]